MQKLFNISGDFDARFCLFADTPGTKQIGTDYNVYSNGSGGTLTFTNALGVLGGEDNDDDSADEILWSNWVYARVEDASASASGNNIYVYWKTSDELGTLGFNIYKSESPNGPFRRVNRPLLLSSGRNTQGYHYCYIDSMDNPQKEYYYKIEEVETNGNRSWIADIETLSNMVADITNELKSKSQNIKYFANDNLTEASRKSFIQSSLIAIPSIAGTIRTPSVELPKDISAYTNLISANAPKFVWKLKTKESGIYKISGKDLLTTKQTDKIVSSRLRLFNLGFEIPLEIIDGGDNQINENDSILFYAPSIKSRFTAENIYWLEMNASDGLRISLNANQPNGDIQDYELTTYHFEENNSYYPESARAEDEDHYFFEAELVGMSESPGEQIISLPIDNLMLTDDNSAIKILFSTYAITNDIELTDSHNVEIYLNDEHLGKAMWRGKGDYLFSAEFPTNLISANNIELKFIVPGNSAQPYHIDIILLDWIELTYPRSLIPTDGTLWISAKKAITYKTGPFDSNDMLIYQITDQRNITKVANFEIASEQSKYYALFYAQPDKTYLALDKTYIQFPKVESASNLIRVSSTDIGANLLVISYPDFVQALQPLLEYRRSQNLKVILATTENIYREYSYGIITPKAIRTFIEHALKNWKLPPQYILLVGDSTVDYLDHNKNGVVSYLPSNLILNNTHGEVTSDDYYVTNLSNEYLPAIIGRLPVKTSEQTSVLVNKILSYEQHLGETWAKKWFFMSGLPVVKGETNIYHLICEDLIAYMPSGFSASKVYAQTTSSADELRNAIVDNINQGCGLINVAGHGFIDSMMPKRAFTNYEIPLLNNPGKYPIFIAETCTNGFFNFIRGECIFEELLRAENKGAIACIASSYLTMPLDEAKVAKAFIRQLTATPMNTLGNILLESKRSVYREYGEPLKDTLDSFIFFGDPAMLVNFSGCNNNADIDGNNIIDYRDLMMFAPNWQNKVGILDVFQPADVDCSGSVDDKDLLIILDLWHRNLSINEKIK